MNPSDPNSRRIQRVTLVVLAAFTTLLFVAMIREFLMALLVAAIASGIFQPLYRWLHQRTGERSSVAALVTIAVVILGLVLPATGFFAIVVQQAARLSEVAQPWVEENFDRLGEFDFLVEKVPALEVLQPYRQELSAKLGEAAASLGSKGVAAVTALARETATLALLSFIVLYSMYFFLKDGRRVLDRILYYLPLAPEDEQQLVGHFVSVSRATIKGTLIIGALQGALGGLAFWVVGLEGAALWGTVMAILSAVPGLGHGFVWLPAAIYLGIAGRLGACIGLLVWGGAVIGSIDNFLRPWLVGKDTQMPDLLILVSTLGGLFLFGPVGFVVGPVVAALFVTVWELYGVAFRDVLPPVRH
jgi:predicted PurR-regulated permease PerM